MASSDRDFCALCLDKGISEKAVTWCTECEVFLCTNCEKHHILRQVKSSAFDQLPEKDLKDVKENFEEIIRYLNCRMGIINVQKTKAVEKIRSMRKSLDVYLNKLEQEILNDLETKHSNIISQMNILLQQLMQRNTKVGKFQNEFSKMTQYATELEMYVGLREMEKTTSQAATYIEDLESGDNFDESDLEITISSCLQSILQDVKSFGDVKINTSQSTLPIKTGREDQAQIVAPTVAGIDEIKPSMLKNLTIPDDMKFKLSITACTILPDGKYLIFHDQYNSVNCHLLLFSNDGMFIGKLMAVGGNVCDACYMRNSVVVVAFGPSNDIKLVDIEKKEIIERIILSHSCNAVASDGQILVISFKKKTTKVNLNDMSRTILDGVNADRIALFQGNIIYGTLFGENKVCCYKSTGEPLWTFQNHGIDGPEGIALDKHGFVYIVSRGNNSIMLLSADGKMCKTILSAIYGIKRPYAIDIDRETGTMIVSTEQMDDRRYYESAIVCKLDTVSSERSGDNYDTDNSDYNLVKSFKTDFY